MHHLYLLAGLALATGPSLAAATDAGDPAAGAQLWSQEFPAANGPRSCTSCHDADPRRPGRHRRTGKPIAAMSPAVQAERLSDPAKTEKWLRRNCRWTLGRTCTDTEKANILAFLRTH